MKTFALLFSLLGLTSFIIYLIVKMINKKEQTGKEIVHMVNKQDITDALKVIKTEYGKDIATKVERIFRNETAHFMSGQFLNTYSAGMEKHSAAYPWGWTSMKPIWDKYPQIKPNGFYTMKENNSALAKSIGQKTFVKFPSLLASMISLAEYLKIYRAGRWFSTDPIQQQAYENILATINPSIVNSLT